MYVIGLTGKIAAGKSTVLRMLKDLGAEVIDADALAHELMAPGTAQWKAIKRAFGPGVLNPDGTINRGALAEIVFREPQALRRLEAIVHPAVVNRVKRTLADAEGPVVVIEAIKLFEAGLDRLCDAVWVVTCSREQQVKRLVRERGMSEEGAELRIKAQESQGEKLALADVVIDNSGSLEETRSQVEDRWREIMKSFEAGDGARD